MTPDYISYNKYHRMSAYCKIGQLSSINRFSGGKLTQRIGPVPLGNKKLLPHQKQRYDLQRCSFCSTVILKLLVFKTSRPIHNNFPTSNYTHFRTCRTAFLMRLMYRMKGVTSSLLSPLYLCIIRHFLSFVQALQVWTCSLKNVAHVGKNKLECLMLESVSKINDKRNVRVVRTSAQKHILFSRILGYLYPFLPNAVVVAFVGVYFQVVLNVLTHISATPTNLKQEA